MSRRRQPQPGAVSTGRLVDLSKGMVDVVHPALINDAESVLLRNGNLDEKGTLKPALGRVARYGSNFDTTPLAGMDAFSPDPATSRLVFGTEGGRLYHDTPHLIARYDSQAEWNSGNFQGGASATPEGSLIMPPAGDPTFARASTAFRQNGESVASGVPRYEHHRFPHHRWQDLFDTDQIAAHYTSGGDVAGTTVVSGGVLSYSGGAQATLLRSGLALADGEIIATVDQAHDGGLIARHVDNNNYYVLKLHDDSGAFPSENLRLFRRVAGVYIPLSVANVVWVRGTSANIRFTFHGSLLEVWFNDVRVISTTDTTFTTGGVGMRNSHETAFRVLDLTIHQSAQGLMLEEAATNIVASFPTGWAGSETFLSGYTRRRRITIDRTRIDAVITNFPVFVRLRNTNFDFSQSMPNGHDIRFTAADGTTLLSYERERHDQAGQMAEYHVHIPSVSNTADTVFFMYFRTDTTADGANPTGVWDSNTMGRWSLSENPAGTAPQMRDSTVNANHGTTHGAMTSGQSIEGQVGRALSFDGVDDSVSLANNPWSNRAHGTVMSTIFIPTNVTFPAGISGHTFRYVWGSGAHTNGKLFLRIHADGGSLIMVDNTTSISITLPAGTFTWGVWHHIALTWNGVHMAVYHNGALLGTTAYTQGSGIGTAQDGLGFNWDGNPFFGTFDETVVSNVARSSAWVKASFHSGNNTLLSVSETQGIITATNQGAQAGAAEDTVRLTNGSAIESGYSSPLYTLTPSTVFSLRFKARGTVADGRFDANIRSNNGTVSQFAQVFNLTQAFQTFMATFTTTSDISGANQFIRFDHNGNDAGHIEIAEISLTQRPVATTFPGYGGTRVAETLTVPTANVFNRGNWTIENYYTPQIPMSVGNTEKMLFDITIDTNNFYRLSVGANGEWRFLIRSGGVDRLITSANNAVLQHAAHLWQISGDGTAMRLCVNGVQVGDTTYTEPVGALPANMHIGSNSTGGQQANGAISNLRISSRVRTLAEHQTAWNSGQPLAMDTDATYLLPKNGNLAVTQPITGRWFTPAIDCSMARDRASGQATHVAATPGASGIVVQSRSAATSTGPWSAWAAATNAGLLQHPVNNFVQVLLQLNRSGADSPSVDRLIVSFDGTPAAQLLASDFTAHGQFYFGSLMSLMVVVNRLNAPRRYDGTVLTVLAGSPPHAQYVAAHKNRIFMAHTAANSSRLFFSDVLNVESWPVLNFIDVSPNDGDWITGLLTLDDYLIITKNRSVWLLLGSSIEDFSVRRLHAEAGCIAPRSLTRVGEGFAFVAHDGVYMSNMSQVQLVTERIRKTWDGLNRRRLFQATAIFHRHKLRIDVPNGAGITNNLRIIHDGIRNALYLEEMTAHASCYAKFIEAGRESLLFGHSTVGQISEADTGFTDGGQPINFVWESKHFDFGVPERVKRWRRMFMEIAPAATATNLNVAFIVGGGAPSAALSVNVPGDATNRIHAARLLPSQVGVVQGHSIGFRVTQSTTNGGVGIHGLALDFFVKGARPTL